MRILLAAWFLAHGLAHLPGFLVSWQLRSLPDLPFHTTILSDTVDIGRVGIRLVGLGWLFAAAAFAMLAILVMLRVAWWRELAYVVLTFSFVLCILGWPHSRIGVVSNVVVAFLLVISTRFGWV